MLSQITNKGKKVLVCLLLVFILVSLITQYQGSADVGDYTDVAKFFAGKYKADIRTSHSLTYGFIHAPLVKSFSSVFIMKVSSVLFLILLVLSIFIVSSGDKKTIWLTALCPIIWFTGPWISPIPLASLLFFWGFIFLEKYKISKENKFLFFSGILIGFAWVFWNTVAFFAFIMILSFFWNEKVSKAFMFLISLITGLMPLFIFDTIYYGFPFYSLIKHILANVTVVLYGGVYSTTIAPTFISNYISLLLVFPLFTYLIFTKNQVLENKQLSVFFALSFLLIILNPQVRYILFIMPILLIKLGRLLNEKQFRMQMIVFWCITIMAILPYLVQINYETNSPDLQNAIRNFGNWKAKSITLNYQISQDLGNISIDYPNEKFVVGPAPDDYATLAYVYWGDSINEFISIQDYLAWKEDDFNLFRKRLEAVPKINDRRTIWVEGGIDVNKINKDYGQVNYAISIGNDPVLGNSTLIKSYSKLNLWRIN